MPFFLLETLRVTNGALPARRIVVPTQIRSKVLRSGNSILMRLRQLHYDEAIFGDDPARWDPERFSEKKILRNSSSFKPFGGGVSYCPRRFLARQEMLYFVALVIDRFDIELVAEVPKDGNPSTPQTFPKLDESTPALGVNGPVTGSDAYQYQDERPLVFEKCRTHNNAAVHQALFKDADIYICSQIFVASTYLSHLIEYREFRLCGVTTYVRVWGLSNDHDFKRLRLSPYP